jgi:hypothetical protein
MNNYQKLFFITLSLFSLPIFTKKIVRMNDVSLYEQWTSQQSWFKIVPLAQILEKHSQIQYQNCFGKVHFNFAPFALSKAIPHRGYFKDCFILEIPNGRVQGQEGYVFFDNTFIQEMVWADRYEYLLNIPQLPSDAYQKISGRVAVIAQHAHSNYCHFFNEVLGRLALLEMHGIEYDYLYVMCHSKFVRDALRLWGIDESKIIHPTTSHFGVQADTLIVPSLVLNTNNGFWHAGVNAHPYTLKYVREKLLKAAQQEISKDRFSHRVFISRRDAPSRNILNEDEIVELFKTKGFERYDTGKMSVVEQIALFANADIVVGEHGAGLTNILFCKEGALVIELFQNLIDTSFWFPAQVLNLNYIPVNNLNLNADYFANWRRTNPNFYLKAMGSKVAIPLDKIKKIVESL